jgi:hypothetical protein
LHRLNVQKWENALADEKAWATARLPLSSHSDMAENIDGSREFRLHFGIGFFEGLFAGITATILFRAMMPAKPMSAQATNQAGGVVSSFREHGSEIQLKRESGEHAGDPGLLVTAEADQAKPKFERPGGSPGPNGKGEVLERPGYPGQLLPNGDASKPVQPVSRTLKMS